MRFALLATVCLTACTVAAPYRRYGWGTNNYEPAPYVAPQENGHGAIAYSRSTGRVGFAYGKRSRWHATRDALATCGAADCQLEVWERGQSAVLVKADDGCVYTGFGVFLGYAETMAMSRCAEAGGTDCRIARWIQN